MFVSLLSFIFLAQFFNPHTIDLKQTKFLKSPLGNETYSPPTSSQPPLEDLKNCEAGLIS